MKRILVIGSSGGIGHKVAETLLSKGCRVVGTYYRHPERIEDLSKHECFSSVYLNLEDINSVKTLHELIKKESEELYALVNCAGIVRFEGNDIENDIKIWNETLAVNLAGNYYLAKIFHESISIDGRFIMISSTDSYFGGAITASYAVSKSGVNSLTKSFCLLFRDKKIRVNSVAPGWVTTPMAEINGNDFLRKVAAINPLKRNATPQDVANLIEFLLSDQSEYINGQVISLEGGYTNQDSTLLLEENVQK